jgi:hypothetical protein
MPFWFVELLRVYSLRFRVAWVAFLASACIATLLTMGDPMTPQAIRIGGALILVVICLIIAAVAANKNPRDGGDQ